MLTPIRFVLFVCLIAATLSSAHGAERGSAKQDSAGVLQVVDALAAAWNAHDMDAFSRLFAPDAIWVNVRGNRWVGADAIRSNHVAVHERFYGKSRLQLNDISVRFAAPAVAIVHARETITGSTVPAAAGLNPDSQLSLVLVRTGDRWLITNGHNTNVATAPKRED